MFSVCTQRCPENICRCHFYNSQIISNQAVTLKKKPLVFPKMMILFLIVAAYSFVGNGNVLHVTQEFNL